MYSDSQQNELYWAKDRCCPYINKVVGLTINTATAWWSFVFLTTNLRLQKVWPFYNIKFILKKKKKKKSCFLKKA